MSRVLFGKRGQHESDKLETILRDANIPYFFTDLGHSQSMMREAVEVLSNSTETPVMVDEGVTYIGFESIRKYCGTIL